MSVIVVRYCRSIIAGQAPYPPFELPIKSGRTVEAATTIDFGERVISFGKKLEAFFYSISGEQIMKSCVCKTTQENIKMILANAAALGCICEANVRV